MPIKDHEYVCNICKKEYSTYNTLWFHNKKFHSEDVSKNTNKYSVNTPIGFQKSPDKKMNKLTCVFCNNIYSTPQNRWKHEQKCKNKQTIQQENIELKKEIEILEKKLIAQPVQTKELTANTNNTNNTNNNNTNNNINTNINSNNNINNNYVVINQIGTERIADVPINDIRSIINSDINSVITCTKKVNFNKKLPQYHSFCATTLEGDHFTKINHETQKPEKINKKDFINEVLNSSIKFLNDISVMIEFDEEFRNKISLSEQQKIKDIVKFQDKFHEVKNKRAFFQSINDISYNCKDLILKTWENVQPVEDYNSDAEYSEPDIDPNFKGYESDDSE